MRRSVSMMAATITAVSPAVAAAAMGGGGTSRAAAAAYDNDNEGGGRQHHRALGWVHHKPEESEPTSSYSGKSGKGSSKGSKAGDHWGGGWPASDWWSDATTSWPEPWSSSSGKSGKGSKGSKSGSSDPDIMESYWGWPSPEWPETSSGKSGKGSKSSKGGKSGGCGSGKSGKSGCAEPESEWRAWSEEPEASGKSGKGSKSSKGSKSGGCGSGKSGKTGCDDSSEPWGPPESHWGWSPEPSGKSGKGSKSSKGSKGSKSGEWVYVMQWTGPSAKPDSSSPGVCAPSYGLECDIEDDYEYCSEPGEQAECGSGSTCYDKVLCPEFSTEDPSGVCGVHGGGLDCDHATTFCSEPGEQAECGDGRTCYDAGLCGFGDDGGGGYGGTCGIAIHGGASSALDCGMVTTMCTEPGGYAECAYGSKCYDAGLCDGGKGFCSSEDEFDCEHITTYCDHPGEVGHCPLGQKCYDIDVCAVNEEPPIDETHTDETPVEVMAELSEVCFAKGKVVDCSSWSNDGHDEAISVPFTYTVSTDGNVQPEEVITPMENAILGDVMEHIEGDEKYADFTGKISAAPGDSIADDDWCGDGHSVRCSVVKGEMTIYPAGWEGDGHGIDPCLAADIIEESMEGNDYTEIDGVTGAVYRNSDGDCSDAIVSSAATVVKDEDLSAGALFAIWLAALALIALAFLLLRKRKQAQAMRDDISLISNDLNGSLPNFDDPYANTTDVHQCASKLCAVCNINLEDPRFSPAPKRVNMKKFIEASGICAPCSTVSPTGVDQVNGDFFNQESKEEESEDRDSPPDISQEENANTRGSIMRVPFFQAERNGPLPSVNEIAHDSEIDTELESVADDNDNTTIPPPPPLSFHPAYQQITSAYTQRDDDEESV